MSQTDSSKLTSNLLKSRNYFSWVRNVTLALISRGWLESITGENPRPAYKDPSKPEEAEKAKMREWKTKDDQVMVWILESVDPQIFDIFRYANNAQHMWEMIKEIYDQEQNFSDIYQLKQEMSQIKQSNISNSEYVGELRKKLKELKVYLPITTNLIELQKRSERDEIFTYLSYLDESFKSIRSQVLLHSELPPFQAVVSIVNREESRCLAMGGPQAQSEEHQAQAMTAKTFHQNPRTDGERCTHYKKIRHNRDGCWFLHLEVRPKKWKQSVKGGERDRASSDDTKEEKRKGENDRAYSAMDPFEPVINTVAEMGSTGSGSM
jgi:gag-polypeptide of LTR copia-type